MNSNGNGNNFAMGKKSKIKNKNRRIDAANWRSNIGQPNGNGNNQKSKIRESYENRIRSGRVWQPAGNDTAFVRGSHCPVHRGFGIPPAVPTRIVDNSINREQNRRERREEKDDLFEQQPNSQLLGLHILEKAACMVKDDKAFKKEVFAAYPKIGHCADTRVRFVFDFIKSMNLENELSQLRNDIHLTQYLHDFINHLKREREERQAREARERQAQQLRRVEQLWSEINEQMD